MEWVAQREWLVQKLFAGDVWSFCSLRFSGRFWGSRSTPAFV